MLSKKYKTAERKNAHIRISNKELFQKLHKLLAFFYFQKSFRYSSLTQNLLLEVY